MDRAKTRMADQTLHLQISSNLRLKEEGQVIRPLKQFLTAHLKTQVTYITRESSQDSLVLRLETQLLIK